MAEEKLVIDAIDKETYPATEGVFLFELDRRLRSLVLKEHADLNEQAFISNKNLASYRLLYLNKMIENANKKNEYIRETIYDVTKNQDIGPLDIQEELDSKITFGQKIADYVARFGGSWTFIISFIIFMAIWMAFNVIKPFGLVFDAYPFILLNLALSTLAAIQAPLIMMSQNRASDYDRLQAKNDYMVNKKSEQGVSLLHAKIDHLVQQDQSDLLEIQKLQTEMLVSITEQLDEVQKMNQNLQNHLNNLHNGKG
ncbi:DUF1003 domain-containing protein [Streptococcus caballi]|uniref:DUF1003 domain-containing protein n=1 Tax=Streptococcus caballi TaxID=439220 RepID=UPI00036BD84D|nr:DUF1003 domain-containing protein [Streptococcus caballi]